MPPGQAVASRLVFLITASKAKREVRMSVRMGAMRPATAMRPILGALVCSMWLVAGPALAQVNEVLSTDAHPSQSALFIDVYLGTPDEPLVELLDTIGPLATSGTVTLNMPFLNESGSGTIEFVAAALQLANSSGTVDLGALGTIDYVSAGLGFDIVTGVEPITGGTFDFPFPVLPGSAWIINDGSRVIDNPTGSLELLLGSDYLVARDYGTFPLNLQYDPELEPQLVTSMAGTAETWVRGVDSLGARVHMELKSLIIPELSIADDARLSLNIRGDMFFATVPEPPSGHLLAAALPALAIALYSVWRRRRTLAC